jgi:hypothetical protein
LVYPTHSSPPGGERKNPKIIRTVPTPAAMGVKWVQGAQSPIKTRATYGTPSITPRGRERSSQNSPTAIPTERRINQTGELGDDMLPPKKTFATWRKIRKLPEFSEPPGKDNPRGTKAKIPSQFPHAFYPTMKKFV